MSSVAESTTAEAQLYERHSATVLRYCLRTMGSREDAEDAAQMTFFQAVRAMRRGIVPTFEQAWLLTIAKNECRSRHRANGRRKQLELVRDPQTLEEVAEAPNGSDGTLIGVQQALTRLPEMQRRALLLREWQGRSYADIAQELGVTRPSVEALLFRARRGLARELGHETATRRHAFDLASLLAAVKSALGGGTAVKVAAGIVALATVGTVAGGAEQRPASRPGSQTSAPAASVKTLPSAAETARPVGAAGAVNRPEVAAPSGRAAISRPDKPGGSAQPQPAAAASPEAKVDQATAPGAPRASDARPPVTTPIAAPSLPDVPGLPELPKVEVPQLPQLPQLPQVPELPQVPQLPDVPNVPDLPSVPDLPLLP